MFSQHYRNKIQELENEYDNLIQALADLLFFNTEEIIKLAKYNFLINRQNFLNILNQYNDTQEKRIAAYRLRDFNNQFIDYEDEITEQYIYFLKNEIVLLKERIRLDKYFQEISFNKNKENKVAVAEKIEEKLNFLEAENKLKFLHEKYLSQKSQELMDISPYTKKTDATIMTVKKELFADSRLMANLHSVQNNLGWLSLVGCALLIPVNFYNMFYAAVISDAPLPVKIFDSFMALGGMALGVVGLIAAVGVISVAAPILILAGSIKAIVEHSFHLGKAIHDRFFGVGKKVDKHINEIESYLEGKYSRFGEGSQTLLNEDAVLFHRLATLHNQRKKLNENITRRSHLLAMAGVALTGSILLFTPAFLVGVGILIGVSAYAIGDVILDHFNYSPLKLAVTGFNKVVNLFRKKPIDLNPFKLVNTQTLTNNFIEKMQQQYQVKLINRNVANQPTYETASQHSSTFSTGAFLSDYNLEKTEETLLSHLTSNILKKSEVKTSSTSPKNIKKTNLYLIDKCDIEMEDDANFSPPENPLR